MARLAATLVLMATLLLGWSSPAWADPPARVGRLDAVVGSVWLLPYGTQDWIKAVRNQPVSVQDRVATDPGSRAEIDIGSTMVRVGDDSEVWMQQLDDDRIIVDVERGSITSRLRTKQAALSFTAVTEEGKFAPLQPGYYRFDQAPPGSKTTVYEGSVRFDGPDSTLVVSAGQQAEFWRDPPASAGAAPGPTSYTLTAPDRDAFEQWSTAQDQAEGRLQQPVYVSPEMPGASDLQQYGQWADTPEYGALWTPTSVAADWAPYTDGHWDWVDPWGWTWIDTAAWGFAPFHYGRWVRYRERWGWAPGAYVPRPVYAPALVGWVGNAPPPRSVPGRGPGPSVGWFPLSPRDAYVPGFKATPGYIRSVNAGHARAIPNLNAIAQNPTLAVQNHQYMNRGIPGAMTVVPANVVTDRQFVPGFRQRGNDRGPGQGVADLSNAPVRPVAPIGAPPQASPRAGVGPRFAQNGQGPSVSAMPGRAMVPGAPSGPGRPGAPTPVAVSAQPAIPQAPAGFGQPDGRRGMPVPGAPTGAAQASEERRYQQQPVPRAERQGVVTAQGQPVPAAPTGGPSGDPSVTRFNHAPEFQGQPQIRPPQAQPPRGDQPRFNVPDQAQGLQQQQMEQQQQLQRQQQFQLEQQQRQQRSQVDQQQVQQRQQQLQMEQQRRQQQSQIEQQQQQQRQQQFQMEQQQRQQRAQVEQQQVQQRQQQLQMEQQRRQQQSQMEQQQQQQFQMEQQQRQQRAQIEQQQQMQRQQQVQMQQQQRQQQAQPPRSVQPGEPHNRGER